MTVVNSIKLSNSGSRQNVKNILGCAVKNRNGYYKELLRRDLRRGDTIESFMKAGFIDIQRDPNTYKYNITDKGDEYYKDIFGKLSYWRKRLSGELERFLKKRL